MALLQELQPPEPNKPMYVERLKELRITNDKRPPEPPAHTIANDLQAALYKIKTKVGVNIICPYQEKNNNKKKQEKTMH